MLVSENESHGTMYQEMQQQREFHMDHEGRLGRIEGKLESFSTKEDVKKVELSVEKAISSQTKWIFAGILLPIFIASIGWVLWAIEYFSE